MQQFTLNIRTKRLPKEIFATVTRARRELCLSYARCNFPEETYLWDWADGTLFDDNAAWRLLPKDIARALANTLSPAELAACLQDAISDDESRAPGAALARVAATLKENTDLDEKVVVWAMTAAVEREAALRFQALVEVRGPKFEYSPRRAHQGHQLVVELQQRQADSARTLEEIGIKL